MKKLKPPWMICEACEHWERKTTHAPHVGECHQAPPHFSAVVNTWRFPLTAGNDWCSQWQEDAESKARTDYLNARATLDKYRRARAKSGEAAE